MLGIEYLAELGETNVVRLLTEALTADVEAVLADDTALVATDAAARLVYMFSLGAAKQGAVDVTQR